MPEDVARSPAPAPPVGSASASVAAVRGLHAAQPGDGHHEQQGARRGQVRYPPPAPGHYLMLASGPAAVNRARARLARDVIRRSLLDVADESPEALLRGLRGAGLGRRAAAGARPRRRASTPCSPAGRGRPRRGARGAAAPLRRGHAAHRGGQRRARRVHARVHAGAVAAVRALARPEAQPAGRQRHHASGGAADDRARRRSPSGRATTAASARSGRATGPTPPRAAPCAWCCCTSRAPCPAPATRRRRAGRPSTRYCVAENTGRHAVGELPPQRRRRRRRRAVTVHCGEAPAQLPRHGERPARAASSTSARRRWRRLGQNNAPHRAGRVLRRARARSTRRPCARARMVAARRAALPVPAGPAARRAVFRRALRRRGRGFRGCTASPTTS